MWEQPPLLSRHSLVPVVAGGGGLVTLRSSAPLHHLITLIMMATTQGPVNYHIPEEDVTEPLSRAAPGRNLEAIPLSEPRGAQKDKYCRIHP